MFVGVCKLELIVFIEIVLGVFDIVSVSLGVIEDEIIIFVLRMFGFKLISSFFRKVIFEVIE